MLRNLELRIGNYCVIYPNLKFHETDPDSPPDYKSLREIVSVLKLLGISRHEIIRALRDVGLDADAAEKVYENEDPKSANDLDEPSM